MNKPHLTTASRFLFAMSPFFLVSLRAQAPPAFTISTVAGTGTAAYSGDGGPAISAAISDPRGVAVDGAGNVYFADYANNRVRKISTGGTITTIAGTGKAGFSGDGGQAASAQLSEPIRVEVDAAGNLYISDSGNNRIRKVTAGGIISTIAGNGSAGISGEGIQATQAAVGGPADATPDTAGNLFIAEGSVIRRVDASGVITTVAGNGVTGYSGDNGPALKASFDNAVCVTADAAGDLFISDQFNQRIRKVTASTGIVTTVAGSGVAGYAGDGGEGTAAHLYNPVGTAVDAAGNLYIADGGNSRIRLLLANGTITTVAGTSTAGFTGDGGPAAMAEIDSPHTVALAPSGGIYFADDVNERIRLLTPVPQPPAITLSGIVPVFSSATTIQPGEWCSIYGTHFAVGTTAWNGNFPTSLGNTTVTVNGKNAYLWFVSPTQINFQAPDDTAIGPVSVVVTNPAGSFMATVTLAQYGPSFSMLNAKYPAAIVVTPGSPGNTGAGYDIIAPVGAFAYSTRPVKAGETIILYGVGFGPTTPTVLAGQLYSGAAPSVTLPIITIGGVQAQVAFGGIIEAGLFQFNVVVPAAGSGDQLLSAQIGGATTPNNVFLTIQ